MQLFQMEQKLVPDIDKVNVLYIDIAGPQNMDPEDNGNIMFWTFKDGLSPEWVVYPPERVCGVGGRIGTGGYFPHVC